MLDRWRRLDERERRLLLEALAALARARLTLWLRPFSATWRDLTGPTPRPMSVADADPVDPALVTLAVRRASRVIPASTCLPQALATYSMLTRRGILAEVRIGVAKDGRRGFEAHAWVELDGAVLIGQLRDLHRFEPLPRLSQGGG